MRIVRIIVNSMSLFACMAFIPWFAWNIYLHGPWINWLEFSPLLAFALIGLFCCARDCWEDLSDDL